MKHLIASVRILLCVFAIAGLFSGPAQGAKEKKMEPVKLDDPLVQLKEEAVIGTDGKFMTLLDSQGLKSDIQAPEKMRAFLGAIPLARTGMGAGYIYAIRRATLVWSTGTCSITGTREQAMQRILMALKNLGLKEGDGKGALLWTLEESCLLHTLIIARPEDRIVDGHPVSTTKIVWKVENTNVSEPATLSHVLAVFPFMKDRRIEDSVYSELGPINVEALTLGGTSRRAYDWELLLAPPEKPAEKRPDKNRKTVTLLSQVEALIEKLGYARAGDDPARAVYTRQGSTVSVDQVPGGEKVHIRFQPEK